MTEAQAIAGPVAEVERLLKELASGFVAHPECLEVETELVGTRLAVSVRPHPEDVGRMVGSRSVMHHAIMLLLTVAAERRGFGLHYGSVKEDLAGGRKCERGEPYMADPKWPKAAVLHRFDCILRLLFAHPFALVVNDFNPDKTTLVLHLDGRERKLVPDAELTDALSRVFHATGAAVGRRIFVDRVVRRAARRPSATGQHGRAAGAV